MYFYTPILKIKIFVIISLVLVQIVVAGGSPECHWGLKGGAGWIGGKLGGGEALLGTVRDSDCLNRTTLIKLNYGGSDPDLSKSEGASHFRGARAQKHISRTIWDTEVRSRYTPYF